PGPPLFPSTTLFRSAVHYHLRPVADQLQAPARLGLGGGAGEVADGAALPLEERERRVLALDRVPRRAGEAHDARRQAQQVRQERSEEHTSELQSREK